MPLDLCAVVRLDQRIMTMGKYLPWAHLQLRGTSLLLGFSISISVYLQGMFGNWMRRQTFSGNWGCLSKNCPCVNGYYFGTSQRNLVFWDLFKFWLVHFEAGTPGCIAKSILESLVFQLVEIVWIKISHLLLRKRKDSHINEKLVHFKRPSIFT